MENVSIVIPVWNEEKNIASLVKRIDESLSPKKITYEIIFIDDHSTDGTQVAITSFQKKYPVELFVKQGRKGKAFSLIEGFKKAKHNVLVMLDADLQYPPEEIPLMLAKINAGADIVVADRKKAHTSRLRQILSNSFKNIFGKVLFGLGQDVQSGLKVFKKEVYETVLFTPKTGWTFDLEFLHRARHAGFVIESHPIVFEERKNGKSKVSALQVSIEIGYSALSLKTKRLPPQAIAPTQSSGMQGAGIGFKRKKYITHTTLHHSQSAIRTFLLKQKLFWGALLGIFIIGLFINSLRTLQVTIGFLSVIYFLDVVFNLYLILKSLHLPQEITFTKEELDVIKEKSLPMYSILCPLYKESHIIPHFLKSIGKLDYPKEKLDVILLLEEDDKVSIKEVAKMDLPSYVRYVVVPNSQPKTKPKACNYGLSMAKGEYLVIYDAEDMPDPQQLKKAYIAFQKTGKNIVCLQAKLNYYNPHQNLLTRFFTAEYSLWFDVTLTGLQSINTSIPLGGTSNHFRTADLKTLEGWDPFNVTEDADLGIRLFKKGYKTAIIDSVTLEEANSKVGNWIRQRSRWIKGYMQTYLVHTRDLFGFKDVKGIHGLFFHLTIGGKIAFILINPMLWLATISYFALFAIVGPTIESLYPSIVFYMAATSLVVGNFLFLYYYMIGLAKRDQWNLVKFVFFVPIYWLLISWAGAVAFYQLLFKPHYWEKTIHGLHLSKKQKKVLAKVIIEQEETRSTITLPRYFKARFLAFVEKSKAYIGGMFLVSASIFANFLNFGFNAYLGRVLKLEDFALVSLVGGFLSFATILFGAFSTTSNYRAAFLMGKHGEGSGRDYWKLSRKFAIFVSIFITAVWLLSTPILMHNFDAETPFLFITFGLVLLVGLANSVDRGFISAKLMFGSLALVNFVEPVVKLLCAVILVQIGHANWAYVSIPLSTFSTFLVGYFLIISQVKPTKHQALEHEVKRPQTKFFTASLFTSFSSTVFMSMDVVLANHYLGSHEAGKYALLSLVGKMVYFLGGLTTPFIVPILSRNEGANKDSAKTLTILLATTGGLAFFGFICFGLFGSLSIPLLYGAKAQQIVPYLIIFTYGMMCFTISKVFINYYLVKKIFSFTTIASLLGIVQFVLIALFHKSAGQIAVDMGAVWTVHLLSMSLLHIFIDKVKIVERNVGDFLGIFKNNGEIKEKKSSALKILIFNWRDTKHKWAGGAEVYIHELAKEWVREGNYVTVFCGNDSKSQKNQIIDGVHIVRRGGFYTVYVWAFLYHIFKFRGKFDVIIDSENGIPFFTPLYAIRPVFLLIHHVHQEVFTKSLRWPFSYIASFLEGKLMPVVYKKTQVLTVSPSSKEEILKHKLSSSDPIVVYNGINHDVFKPGRKSKTPLVLYVGRLQYYKSLNVFIKAAKEVAAKVPNAKFVIAGEGGEKEKLIKYAKKLNMENKILFTGKVSNEEKITLMQNAWVFVNPSFMEGWGITTIEANACGTPAVASNVPGLRDSIQNNKTGFLVDYGNFVHFATKITKLINEKELRSEMEKEAIEWASQYSWKISSRKFLAVLRNQIALREVTQSGINVSLGGAYANK